MPFSFVILFLECKIIFSVDKMSAYDLNALYNISDVVVNIASNEGWGLSSTEALLAGTPIVNNVTGGLQDQMRFENDKGEWITFDKKFSTNNQKSFDKHGKWAKPVFPSNRSLQGSPLTPYIFDDIVDYKECAEAIYYWWMMNDEDRVKAGLIGREHFMKSEIESKRSVLLSLLEPVITIFMGGFILLIVLAILIPIMQMILFIMTKMMSQRWCAGSNG